MASAVINVIKDKRLCFVLIKSEIKVKETGEKDPNV